MPKMTVAQLQAFLAESFPQMDDLNLRIEEVRPRYLRARAATSEKNLRPGGTIAGPTMVAMADVVVYLAILATLGHGEQAVTTNLNINFMRRPEPADLIAEARLLKLGRRLAVGDVMIYSDDGSDAADHPVAHATLTYAIPSPG
ncbi:MAG: PaaI family thioesterase [Proteobacteria bacterium]|nr:PaaI family thioesterase [Pseudomonadota bacterium]